MLIFIIIIAFILLGLFLEKGLDCDFGILIWAIGIVCLLFTSVMLPINRYEVKKGIRQYNSLKNTVENARKNQISEIERASILRSIAEMNMDVESLQYYNSTIFDIFIPDEVMSLKPLE